VLLNDTFIWLGSYSYSMRLPVPQFRTVYGVYIGSKWATSPVIHTPAFRKLVGAEPTDRVVALVMVGECFFRRDLFFESLTISGCDLARLQCVLRGNVCRLGTCGYPSCAVPSDIRGAQLVSRQDITHWGLVNGGHTRPIRTVVRIWELTVCYFGIHSETTAQPSKQSFFNSSKYLRFFGLVLDSELLSIPLSVLV
jgi:hypothetical protein